MSSARSQQHEVGKIAGIPIVIDASDFDADFLALMSFPKASDAVSELKAHNKVLDFYSSKISELMGSIVLLDDQIKNRNDLSNKIIETAKSFLFLTSEARKTEVRNQLDEGGRLLKKMMSLEEQCLGKVGDAGEFLDRLISATNSALSQTRDPSGRHLYHEDFEKITNNYRLTMQLFENVLKNKAAADHVLADCARELTLLRIDIAWMRPYLSTELVKPGRWDEEFHTVIPNHLLPDVVDDHTPSVSQKSTAPASRRGSQPDVPSVVTIRTSPAMSVSSRFYQPPPKPVAPPSQPPEVKPEKKRCCVIL